jgi:hypothetical protein
MFVVEAKVLGDRLVVTSRAHEPGFLPISDMDAIVGRNGCSAGAAMFTHLAFSGKSMLFDRDSLATLEKETVPFLLALLFSLFSNQVSVG